MDPLPQIEAFIHDLGSPKRSHTFWGFWVVAAITFFLFWLGHHRMVNEPNRWLIGESTDGFKNYMNAAWHVAHDTTYTAFRGGNYPWGEHILFTDMQPLLAQGMQWWNWHVGDIRGEVIGIINVFQILSLVLGAGCMYLLFRKLHFPVWYAGVLGIAITFLSPQYGRFDSHFGLSHSWVIPLLILLVFNYEERYSRRYQSLLIGILLFVAAQLHFYYFGMGALFLLLYTIFQWLAAPGWRNFRVRVFHLVVMILLPFACLNVWMNWANAVNDRPSFPVGFTTYVASLPGLFMPDSLLRAAGWFPVEFESRHYLGLVVSGFILWLFYRKFKLFEASWDQEASHRVHKRCLRGLVFAAAALLVFSTGFPFRLPGMGWLLEYLGPLRQFRGLGRFSWPFYYTANVAAFYVIWQYAKRLNGKIGGRLPWKWVLAMTPALILVWEAYVFHMSKPNALSPNFTHRSVVTKDPETWLNKVDFSVYQAILPIPFTHIGSEHLIYDLNFWLYEKQYYTVYHTALPDLGVNMSRTSLGQTIKSVQLVLEPCEPPQILEEFPNNRPIALLVEPKLPPEELAPYRYLLQKAKPVYAGEKMKVYSLEIEDIRAVQRELAEQIEAEMDRQAIYPVGKGWYSEKPPLPYRYVSMDSLTTSKHIFQGEGALASKSGDTTWLWKGPLPQGTYYVSFWVKADEDQGVMRVLEMAGIGSNGAFVSKNSHELRFNVRAIVNGWALFDIPFDMKEDMQTAAFYLKPGTVNVPCYIDELLIKRFDSFLYKKQPGWVIRNNFWYKR